MTLRKLLWLAPVVGAAGLWTGRRPAARRRPRPRGPVAQGDPKPAVTLPVSQVVLFNTGVGYFARSGEVEGDARVDLTFPEPDINDLLKRMTLQDLDGGRVAAVSLRQPASRSTARWPASPST